jgi:hypothetical protein
MMTIQDFRFITDDTVTPEIIDASNLICFGNADNHKIIQQVADQLPLSFAGEKLTVNGAEGIDGVGGLVMIYPNPLNPKRYIVLCSGNPRVVAPMAAALLQPPQLAAIPQEDLVVFSKEGRMLVQSQQPEPDAEGQEGWMAPQPWPRGAVFDRHWKLPASVEQMLIPAPAAPVEDGAEDGAVEAEADPEAE